MAVLQAWCIGFMKVAALAIVTMGCLSMEDQKHFCLPQHYRPQLPFFFFWKRLILKSRYQTPVLFNNNSCARMVV